MLSGWLKYLEILPKKTLGALLVCLTCFVGLVDYFAGTDATFSAIYLVPIGIAAWFIGQRAAHLLAIASSILWVGGDILAGAHYSNRFIPAWNVAARFVVFIVAVQLIVELRKLHDDMESRAERRAAKLTAARERLERELLHISEREQRRVGHDIHDSLCQHLTGTALAGQVLAENLKSKGLAQARDASRVVELIEEAIRLGRNLAKGLSSVPLAPDGLMEALEDFAVSTSELFKISCRFECPVPVLIDDSEISEHLYRITQEAVGNAIKHGQARNIVIRLEMSDSAKMLRVIDDGTGLAPAPMRGKGMGLSIMSYRAELIGAKFSVRRRESRGTVMTCALPLQEKVSA